jgi:cytoskeleton protein RodZ
MGSSWLRLAAKRSRHRQDPAAGPLGGVDGESIIGCWGKSAEGQSLMALRVPKNDVGGRLRLAREKKGVDLDRAAEDTQIDRSHLQALEANAPLDEHHAGLYARIFLREYARYLGLDPKPLIGAYRASHPEPDRPLIGGPAPVDRRPGRWAGPLLAVLSAGALIGLAVAGELRRSPEVPVPPAAMEPATPSPSVEVADEPASPPPAKRLVLELQVRDAASWIQVVRGEEVVFEDTLEPGAIRTFHARRELGVVLGNAPAVRLTANDTPLPVPSDTSVYTASVVLREGIPRIVDGG